MSVMIHLCSSDVKYGVSLKIFKGRKIHKKVFLVPFQKIKGKLKRNGEESVSLYTFPYVLINRF